LVADIVLVIEVCLTELSTLVLDVAIRTWWSASVQRKVAARFKLMGITKHRIPSASGKGGTSF
jgi:hypothetical protein